MAFTSQLGTVDSIAGGSFGTGIFDPGNNFSENVAQSMLTDVVELEEFFRLAADRVFYFGLYDPGPSGEYGQEATHNFVSEDISNVFAFINQGEDNKTLDIDQYLGFTCRFFPDPIGNQFGLSTSGLGLKNIVGVVTSEDASNLIFDPLGFPNTVGRAYNLPQTILTQLVVPFNEQFASNVFDLDDLIDSSATTYDRGPSHEVIKQSVSFHIQGAACPDKEYSPFLGSTDPDYPAVSATPPTLGSGVLTLTHPRVSPTLTLVLKNPEFGNTDTLTFTKIDQQTRGGDRKIFNDPKWPKSQIFELKVINICDTLTVDEIVAFLNTSLGEEIGLLDWEGRNWKGIILAPNTDVTQQIGGHQVTIIFEGELV